VRCVRHLVLRPTSEIDLIQNRQYESGTQIWSVDGYEYVSSI
jgi:hypothetical protein